MADQFWNGKRVLVTGADGFMGSHLVEELLRHQARVIAFTRSTSTHGTSQIKLKHLGGVAAELERVIAGNVSSPETTRIIEDAAPDVIMHLAAEAYVPRSFEHPEEVFAVNATGTLYVLEAARRLPKLERIVVTSDLRTLRVQNALRSAVEGTVSIRIAMVWPAPVTPTPSAP